MEGLANLVFLAFLIGIFYFMLIRPQRRRVEQHRKLIESVALGDEIVTIGGIFGTVRALREDEMELQIAEGTTIRLIKSAVARRVTQDVEEGLGATGEETA